MLKIHTRYYYRSGKPGQTSTCSNTQIRSINQSIRIGYHHQQRKLKPKPYEHKKVFFSFLTHFFSLLREDHVRFTLVPFKHLSNQSCRKYNRPFSCLNNVYSYSFLYSESLERTPIENSQLSKINMDISLLLDQTKLLKRVFTKKFILF